MWIPAGETVKVPSVVTRLVFEMSTVVSALAVAVTVGIWTKVVLVVSVKLMLLISSVVVRVDGDVASLVDAKFVVKVLLVPMV